MPTKSNAAGSGPRGARGVKFSFGKQNRLDHPEPRHLLQPRHRWAAALGGNRLGGLRQLLAGDAHGIACLPPDHPRRKPSLPRLAWLEREAAP